ncbi:hypothetical protein [Phyllobacterium myrsinacearum]|uniref:Uncharacterized protein n=1 Tax=Phyllobacterium myrsinacearum TaxID=28101 RepID=A0A839ER02_9HYPH|nr:hypothetical protein [Phyllobacterium myrsinacearum]MBA8879030.1 hypothetical protein [Phyllobacterium myrsinacearum]
MLKSCIWIVAVVGLAFVTASLLVPDETDFPETPEQTSEPLSTIRLNASGDRLLLRTGQHDYEFILPDNQLNGAIDLQNETHDADRALGNPSRFIVSPIDLTKDGAATIDIEVMYGGYDPSLSETKTILSDQTRSRLTTYGFSPSNGNVVGDIDPPLYMTWSARLSGQQYPVNSRGDYEGADLTALAYPELLVKLDDPDRQKQNHRSNAWLAPFRSTKRAIQLALLIPFLMLVGYAGPSG